MNRVIDQKEKYRYKTISGIFLKFIGIFSINTLALFLLIYILFNSMIIAGWVLPANHIEKELKQKEESIEKAEVITEGIVPDGSSYGVYGSAGEYRYGNFSLEDKNEAWDCYEKKMIYPGGGGYYRFIARENGEICIVKYYIATRFNCGSFGRKLPSPEFLMTILYVILFLMQTILLARYFGRYMRSRLAALNQVTEKIQKQDLDFAREHSDLKEIEEVLTSLYQMKTALKDSLEQQWNMEQQKNEQIAALAHDIKTPLTIIKGNAELLQESELSKGEAEYNEYILQSITVIEEYLMILNDILGTEKTTALEKIETMSCEQLADKLEEQTKLQTSARQLRLMIHRKILYGSITCSQNQILRAWNNILSNAIDYTLPGKTIHINITITETQEGKYLTAAIIDQGPGFTPQDLKHATEQFYQGDKSRHTKTHYGLGLHTAAHFAQTQGGYLTLENTETHHAKVTLHLKTD
ncbi:sensor histidine kinase [Bariatricus sp. SGI.154]|uniref:sensor histidine kinase n=1 Tax=Bariatricus sp. SGI.154 TaxID=3420549 RepID=UPI003CFD9991